MTHILLASHAGQTSIGAVRIAAHVAERLGARLHVVGVIPGLEPMDYGFGILYAGGAEDEAALTQELSAELKEQLAACGITNAELVIRAGQPVPEIAAEAQSSGASLIVVGLGPHSAIDRALGRETALHLAQMATDTPVLAVLADACALPRRIVAGIDFSPTSFQAAHTAARLLATGGTLHLVHVHVPAEAGVGRALDIDDRLAALADELPLPDGAGVHFAIVDGPASHALLDEAKRAGADLIALGSHGYGAWKRLTIGSVAAKILRLATTAVLVQPAGARMPE